MTILFYIFLLNILFYPPQLQASSLVESLEKSYRSISDFEARFEQIEIQPLLNRTRKTNGVIYSLSAGKIFWHTTSPSILKLVSNGKEVWMYDEKAAQVIHERWERLDDQTRLALLFLRREENIRDHFKVSEKGERKEVILIPKKRIGIEKIVLRLATLPSEKIVFLKKIVFYFPLDKKTELILSDIKLNQKLIEKHAAKPIDPSIDPQFNFINLLKVLDKKSK